MSFYSPKISDDLFFFFFFLVITSDFNIFYPHFSNLYHFSPKMSDFLQKTTKINVFSAKFSKKPRKTQGLFENPKKNPGTQDCFRKPKILGENPSSGNAGFWCRVLRRFAELVLPSSDLVQV